MKFNYVFVILIFSSLFISCQPQIIEITTDIKDPNTRSFAFQNQIENIFETVQLGRPEPINYDFGDRKLVLELRTAGSTQYVFMTPDTKIKISKTPQQGEFVITSNHQKEQDLLASFDKELSIAETKYSHYEIMNSNLKDFEVKLVEKYANLNAVVGMAKKEGRVDKKILYWLEERIKAAEINSKINYPAYFKFLRKQNPELPENYYDFVKNFNFDDPQLFYFYDIKSVGAAIIAHKFNYAEMESLGAYYSAQFNAVKEYTSNPIIKDLYEYKFLNEKINMAGGIDGIEDEINEYLTTSKNQDNIQELNQIIASWSHLKKGLEAPNFSAFTRDGKEVKLSDLRGKNVYIDVWATWCGPCISEIPALKAMETKYHDENVEFVSVSIDVASDKQKWMDFVEKRELKGIQIMAENDWRSEITRNYNIQGIPRFLLIDEEGKIVSADAPRPSSTRQLESLLATVLN